MSVKFVDCKFENCNVRGDNDIAHALAVALAENAKAIRALAVVHTSGRHKDTGLWVGVGHGEFVADRCEFKNTGDTVK